jgi:hypothetical protein
MGRSGYSDDYDFRTLNLWRGTVERSIRGKRGQAFLKEMLAVLDAMPEKRLISKRLEENGEVCSLGAVGRSRGVSNDVMHAVSPVDDFDEAEHTHSIAGLFSISHALACEIMYINDEVEWRHETPELRFARVRAWVERQILP